jgi:hypothetical protein
MEKNSKDILTKGLLEGYAGKGIQGSDIRAGFDIKTSDYKGSEGRYHDEWAANFNGGGQELVELINGEKATRVYAGGTPSVDKLQELGLTKKDVIGKLVFFVNKLGETTRLDQNAEVEEGQWKYTYKVLKSVKEIPIDLGEEEIRFNDNLVFVHFHILSPVK